MIHGIGARRGAGGGARHGAGGHPGAGDRRGTGAGDPAGTVRGGITAGIPTPHGVPAATVLCVPTLDGPATIGIRPVKDRRERQHVPEATAVHRQVPTGALPATIAATIAGLRAPTSRMSQATEDTT